jgi:hypothetical protein
MAIKKGEDLDTTTFGQYFKKVGATEFGIKEKSMHFFKEEIYLGFINRSNKNKKLNLDEMTDEQIFELPILLEGMHGADWFATPPDMVKRKPKI